MLTWRRQLHAHHALRRMNIKLATTGLQLVSCADIGFIIQAKSDYFVIAGERNPKCGKRIICVDNSGAIASQSFKYLAFGFGNSFKRTQFANMRAASVMMTSTVRFATLV